MSWPRAKEKLKVEGKALEQYLKDRPGGETAVAFEERVMDFYAERIVGKGLLEPSGLQLDAFVGPRKPTSPVLPSAETFGAGDAVPASSSPVDPGTPPQLVVTSIDGSESSPSKEAARRALAAGLHVDVSPKSGTPAPGSAPWRQLWTPDNSTVLSPDERRALAVLPSPVRTNGESLSGPMSPGLRSISGPRGLNQAPKFGSNSSLASSKNGGSKASIRALIEDFEKMTSTASSPTDTPVTAPEKPVAERVANPSTLSPAVEEPIPEKDAVIDSSVPARLEERFVDAAEMQSQPELEHQTPTSADPTRRNVLVITHGGVLQSLFTHLLNDLEFDIWTEIQAGFPKHCGLYQLQLQKVVYGNPIDDDWEWRGVVSLMNSVSHNALVGKAGWHQWNPEAGQQRQAHLDAKAAMLVAKALEDSATVALSFLDVAQDDPMIHSADESWEFVATPNPVQFDAVEAEPAPAVSMLVSPAVPLSELGSLAVVTMTVTSATPPASLPVTPIVSPAASQTNIAEEAVSVSSVGFGGQKSSAPLSKSMEQATSAESKPVTPVKPPKIAATEVPEPQISDVAVSETPAASVVKSVPKAKVAKVQQIYTAALPEKTFERKQLALMSPRTDSAGFKAALEKFGGAAKQPKDIADMDAGLPPLKKTTDAKQIPANDDKPPAPKKLKIPETFSH
jgi:hypothetical protein